MLSAHHLSILQTRLLPLPPQIGKPMVQKKRKGTSPLGQMVLVTLIGNHLTFPIWKQVNLDQHTDYWPASLTRSIIGTLPQSGKGLKPPLLPPRPTSWSSRLENRADTAAVITLLLYLQHNTPPHCTNWKYTHLQTQNIYASLPFSIVLTWSILPETFSKI